MRAITVRPRGFCAGVDRAIDIVNLALDLFPSPLYVRKEIVHNRAVVDEFVRRGVIYSVATFSDSDAEAIELAVGPKSPAIGKSLNELNPPESLIIGGIQRGDKAFVPRGSTVIEEGDHLIVIALPEAIAAAESLSG